MGGWPVGKGNRNKLSHFWAWWGPAAANSLSVSAEHPAHPCKRTRAARSGAASGRVCSEPGAPSSAWEGPGHGSRRHSKGPWWKAIGLITNSRSAAWECWCLSLFNVVANHKSLREMPRSLVLSAALALDGSKGWEIIIFYYKAAGSLKQYIFMCFSVYISTYMYGLCICRVDLCCPHFQS